MFQVNVANWKQNNLVERGAAFNNANETGGTPQLQTAIKSTRLPFVTSHKKALTLIFLTFTVALFFTMLLIQLV